MVKTFVQHHLTLDSAEHRNLDSRVREGAKIGGRPLFRGKPIPSLSERKERATGGYQRGTDGVSGYARCQILRALPPPCSFLLPSPNLFSTLFPRDDDGRRRFPRRFFALQVVFFFYLCSFPFHSLSFMPLSAVERSFNRKSYGSLALAKCECECERELIPRERAKGGILARSQTFLANRKRVPG